MAIPQQVVKVFTGNDKALLQVCVSDLTRLLVRNEVTTAKGVPILTYEEVLTVSSVRDRLIQIGDETQPLRPQ